MRMGQVKGIVVSTQKDEHLVGCKLLIVEQIDSSGAVTGKEEVAIDVLSAGVGEKVLLCSGSSARHLLGDEHAPVDLAVVGIIDSMGNI